MQHNLQHSHSLISLAAFLSQHIKFTYSKLLTHRFLSILNNYSLLSQIQAYTPSLQSKHSLLAIYHKFQAYTFAVNKLQSPSHRPWLTRTTCVSCATAVVGSESSYLPNWTMCLNSLVRHLTQNDASMFRL